MLKSLYTLALVAALAAPAALHATPITGQFSIGGTVTNTGTSLDFVSGTVKSGIQTQTDVFATLVPDNTAVSSGPMSIVYSPYSCCTVFTVGQLTTKLLDITATNTSIAGVPITIFGGDALFTAAGFDPTMGTFGFSTQGNGKVTFSATGTATTSPVPEPSTFALMGSGLLGLASAAKRKFMA